MLQEVAEAAVHLLVNLVRSRAGMSLALVAVLCVGLWVASA